MILSVAQTASNMKIFTTLVNKSEPCSAVDLAATSGADVVFTGQFQPNQQLRRAHLIPLKLVFSGIWHHTALSMK